MIEAEIKFEITKQRLQATVVLSKIELAVATEKVEAASNSSRSSGFNYEFATRSTGS